MKERVINVRNIFHSEVEPDGEGFVLTIVADSKDKKERRKYRLHFDSYNWAGYVATGLWSVVGWARKRLASLEHDMRGGQ